MNVSTQHIPRDLSESFISVDLDGSLREIGEQNSSSSQGIFANWRENPIMSTILQSDILRPALSALAFIAVSFAADYAKNNLTSKVGHLEIMPGVTGETVANTYVDTLSRLLRQAIVSEAVEGDEEVLDPFIGAYRHWKAATSQEIYRDHI